MAEPDTRASEASPVRGRGASVRVKLTLSYAGFLVVAGVAMFVVGFLLLRFVPEGNLQLAAGGWAPNRQNLLDVFVRYAWWALAGLVVFGLVGGWLLAGVVLRPLDRITDAARRARDGALDHRVSLPGARDELTDLADTLDQLLDRVEQTLEEERRFAANASHELRTPHTVARAILEVAQADPVNRDVDVVLERLRVTNERAIATTEALLALARVGRGAALRRDPIALDALVGAVVADETADAAANDVRVESTLHPVSVRGDAVLVRQLVANLVRNAIVHNVPGGWVRVATAPGAPAGATLIVRNGGAVLPAGVVATLTEPFVRGAGRTRQAHGPQGAGLGLAIVASIARAHGGTLELDAPDDGGLSVRVWLPSP